MQKEKKNDKKKKIGLYLLFGAISVAFLVMFLSINDFQKIGKVLSTVDGNNLLIAFGLLLVYAFMTPLTLCILAKSQKINASFREVYVVGMTEHFFNGITPFATGGQPIQVYELNKLKVSPSKSTGLLMMNFIIMMIVTNCFAACSLFYYGDFISSAENFQAIAIFGFAMNFLVLAFIISLGVSKNMRKLLNKLFRGLTHIKFLKKILEPKIPLFEEYCENTQNAFKNIFHHKVSFFVCIFVKALTMAIYYAMTFFILRTLNIDIGFDKLFFVMCGTSFAITAVVWLPTPGSSGGIEFAFRSIFVAIVAMTEATAYAGVLIYRLLTYYLILLISLGFYIGFTIYCKNKHIPEPVEEVTNGQSVEVKFVEQDKSVENNINNDILPSETNEEEHD